MSSCKTERPKAKALVYLDARTAGQGPLMTAMTKARKRQRQGQRRQQIPFGDDNQRGKGKSESNSDGKSNGKDEDNGNNKGRDSGNDKGRDNGNDSGNDKGKMRGSSLRSE
jgi:hypothetical protein